MSNYIAVDLKVIEVLAPGVARGAGIDPDRALGGLVRLWHRCWSTEATAMSRSGLAAVFGGDRIEAIIEALVDAEFLEAVEGAWRVRGVERYLRITEARRKGGRMATGNLKRGTSPGSSTPTVRGPPADSRLTPGSTPALSPNTEHRTPNTEKEDDHHQPKIAAFEIVKPDIDAIDSWPKEDFWRAAEVTRRSMGFPPEKWPHPLALSRWWTESRGIAEVRELAEAFTRFTRDKHWSTETPPAPFGAFMKFYNHFLPTKRT